MLGSTLLFLHWTLGMVQPQSFQGSLYPSSTPSRLVVAEGHIQQKLLGKNEPVCEMTHLEPDHPDHNPSPGEPEILHRAQPHTRQHIHPQAQITSSGQQLHLCRSPASLWPCVEVHEGRGCAEESRKLACTHASRTHCSHVALPYTTSGFPKFKLLMGKTLTKT